MRTKQPDPGQKPAGHKHHFLYYIFLQDRKSLRRLPGQPERTLTLLRQAWKKKDNQ